ncbi:hypothetical protein HYT91_03785 [Candidatus Pacearchaeota archaeon]|nr:hypothetical protein [Candidatus Pacearchaeota archaeon]
MSNEKNSGFGKEFNVKTGYVYDTLNVDGVNLLFMVRADDDNRIGEHLNDEILIDKGVRSKPIPINNHLPFGWKG